MVRNTRIQVLASTAATGLVWLNTAVMQPTISLGADEYRFRIAS